jgi:hypothetical protein
MVPSLPWALSLMTRLAVCLPRKSLLIVFFGLAPSELSLRLTLHPARWSSVQSKTDGSVNMFP